MIRAGIVKITIGARTLIAKTCTRCDSLQPASEYFRMKTGYWGTYCKTCTKTLSIKKNKAANRNSMRAATKSGLPWNTMEIKQLKSLVGEGKTTAEIAKMFSRSITSIERTKARYGIKKEN